MLGSKVHRLITMSEKNVSFSRREIIRMAIRLIPECFTMLFTHTYVAITFLMIYGTMWSLNMRFDTAFFAVVACLLSYLEMSVGDFGVGIRNLVNYLTAAKRIQVSMNSSLILIFISFLLQTFLLLDESKKDERLLSVSDKQLFTDVDQENSTIHTTSRVQCHLIQAYWQQVFFHFSLSHSSNPSFSLSESIILPHKYHF